MCADFIKFLSSERNMTISHRSVHLCLVQKSVMIFHTGAVELSQVFDFRKLSTVLESAAKVQENKYSSQRSIKNIRFSIRRFDFSLVAITVKNHFLLSSFVLFSYKKNKQIKTRFSWETFASDGFFAEVVYIYISVSKDVFMC